MRVFSLNMKNKIKFILSCDELKTSCDWSKAVFTPDLDNMYLCAGTADGNIIIWNKTTAKVEKILKEHRYKPASTHIILNKSSYYTKKNQISYMLFIYFSSSVLALAWHPQGNYLVSCDNKKKAIVWI